MRELDNRDSKEMYAYLEARISALENKNKLLEYQLAHAKAQLLAYQMKNLKTDPDAHLGGTHA